MYNPDNQYRCTIIRGKSQSEMEDLLPFYAQTVHRICPCKKNEFDVRCNNLLSNFFYNISSFSELPHDKQKTVRNHVTEVMGKLLGLFFTNEEGLICESTNCIHLNRHHDYPTFFKSICYNLQFPNAASNTNFMKQHMKNGINIKPLCFVICLLEYARLNGNLLLTKQEIGYYVLNNLDVLQGKVNEKEVYEQIKYDRDNNIKKNKLYGSHDWQHIKEMFNLLNLSNLCLSDKDYIWLNKDERKAIDIFLDYKKNQTFDIYKYNINEQKDIERLKLDWQFYYSSMYSEISKIETQFTTIETDEQNAEIRQRGAVGLTTVELGDQGESLVYNMEKERVRKYKERLVNKVLLLGKTKGLGYDISSIEADENPQNPEFARYIEVKSTKRITKPSFDNNWTDSINLTAKEWIAAKQYREYYNIYRVYFTREDTIIVRIQNPYKMNEDGEIEVFPTIYQMDFKKSAITKQYFPKK